MHDFQNSRATKLEVCMILTPVLGIKSCIPPCFLQKIMHTAANVAGQFSKSCIPLHLMHENVRMGRELPV